MLANNGAGPLPKSRPLDPGDRAAQGIGDALLARPSALPGENPPHEAAKRPRQKVRVAHQLHAHSLGKGQDPLAIGQLPKNPIHKMGGRVRHAPRGAGGADRAALTGKRQQQVIAAVATSDPRKAVTVEATFQVVAKLALHEARHVALARPQFGVEKVRDISQGIAIEMVVDRSSSMSEEMFYKGRTVTRLDVVKKSMVL